MNHRVIPFSPPDISDLEIAEVTQALRSGWITTGPRTKLLERRLAAYIETGRTDIDCEGDEGLARWSNRVVCLNSATAAEELNLRMLGVGEGDEVLVPAYTYTASASAALHCGAKVRFIDIQKNGDPLTHMPEMDYDALEAAITEKTKAIVTVDLFYQTVKKAIGAADHPVTAIVTISPFWSPMVSRSRMLVSLDAPRGPVIRISCVAEYGSAVNMMTLEGRQ